MQIRSEKWVVLCSTFWIESERLLCHLVANSGQKSTTCESTRGMPLEIGRSNMRCWSGRAGREVPVPVCFSSVT